MFPPETSVVLSAALVSLLMVFTPQGWKVSRYGATLTHELGHALFSLGTRGRVKAIRLYRDSSGGTHTNREVKIFPFGAIIASFFGYPAPIIFGTVILALATLDQVNAAMWGIVGAGAITLLYIRNPFGLLVTLVWLGSSAGVLFYFPEYSPWFTAWTGTLMLFGGFKDLWMLHRIARESNETDLHNLRDHSHLPLVFWHWMMWLVGIISVVLLAALLALQNGLVVI